MDRLQKKDYIQSLNTDLKSAGLVVVTHYQGLTVAEISQLRRKARDAGAKFQVTKNTLTKLSLDGTNFAGIVEMFSGPTAIAYSEDPVAAAKVLVDYAKDNEKLKILGGALGERQLKLAEVQTLAKMPSLDQLRSTILGLLQAPATKIARVLQEPGGQVARVLNAHAQNN